MSECVCVSHLVFVVAVVRAGYDGQDGVLEVGVVEVFGVADHHLHQGRLQMGPAAHGRSKLLKGERERYRESICVCIYIFI